MEQFTGDNATCNVCLAYRKRWADKSPEIVKELWQKYHDEHRGNNFKRNCVLGNMKSNKHVDRSLDRGGDEKCWMKTIDDMMEVKLVNDFLE